MSITVNGQSRVPPGFRFHPTEEELLNYYLRKKVACEKIELDVIRDVDLNKLEPWDIQEKCKIGSTPQNDWYFFSHKDKKYPTGTRTNRATAAGFWKATGRDKIIYTSLKRIGMRKTLVFYKGRAPHGQKSDWIMHEYRLDEHQENNSQSNACSSLGELTGQEDGWVICRVFKKKNYHKTINSPNNSSSFSSEGKTGGMLHRHSVNDDRPLDQILHYMGRSACKHESEHNPGKAGSMLENRSATASTANNTSGGNYMKYLLPIEVSTPTGNGLLERFMKLPALESPTNFPTRDCPQQMEQFSRCGEVQPSDGVNANNSGGPLHHPETSIHDWAALDRLVASHLNGQSEASRQLTCFDDTARYAAFCSTTPSTALMSGSPHEYNNGDGDMDLWAFTGSVSSSGSDLHCHTSE